MLCMTNDAKKKEYIESLDKVVDALIDVSSDLTRIDITFNGVHDFALSDNTVNKDLKATIREIDSITTSLFIKDKPE